MKGYIEELVMFLRVIAHVFIILIGVLRMFTDGDLSPVILSALLILCVENYLQTNAAIYGRK